jgi:hypothetical protein
MAPLVVIFCFFGDAQPTGPDPRDTVMMGFLWFAGNLAIVAVVLATKGQKAGPAKTPTAIIISVPWIILYLILAIRELVKN